MKNHFKHDIIHNNFIDQALFQQSIDYILNNNTQYNKIGTLSEKTIHAVLKYYYAPNTDFHEIKIEQYYADIFVDYEIIEIQTRHFNLMRKKLECFLRNYEVTIVYPVAYTKWLKWLNEETGEISEKRKSPKKGTIYEIMPELYKIKDFLLLKNIHFVVCFINVEETRLLNGWSKDKKKGSQRFDGLPVDLYDEIHFDIDTGYSFFIPDGLQSTFTSEEFRKVAKISRSLANVTLNILHYVGTVQRVGKQGNFYLYQLS